MEINFSACTSARVLPADRTPWTGLSAHSFNRDTLTLRVRSRSVDPRLSDCALEGNSYKICQFALGQTGGRNAEGQVLIERGIVPRCSEKSLHTYVGTKVSAATTLPVANPL